jgi:hypothetical protein
VIVDVLDETDFGVLINKEFHGKLNIVAGMSDHAVYPYYWPESGGPETRGFTIPFYLRVLNTDTKTYNPLLFNQNMDQTVPSWDQMTVSLATDLFNTLFFAIFESDLLDVSINDKIAGKVVGFNTDAMRFLFPNIGDKYTGGKSVILEIKTHDWSPQTTNFRNMNGRVGIFIELDLNWYVYNNATPDPSMTVKKCGSMCEKFVTLTTEISITFSLGIDNDKSKSISLGWLNLDIGGLIVKDPLFNISQERLFTFMNQLIDSLMIGAPLIPFKNFLEQFRATVDIQKDQRINFELTPIAQKDE